MLKIINRAKKNETGFTLVELLVVVVIIGFLVAITVPIYNSIQENAKLRAHQANIRIIEGAISIYTIENEGAVPASNDALAGHIDPWPISPGTYNVSGGVLTANPSKADTQNAIDNGTEVNWP